jgi:hypothetical protein
VNSEFGRARDFLAASLRSPNMLIRLQSDFRQEAGPGTTLRKRHDYIQAGRAVVANIPERPRGCVHDRRLSLIVMVRYRSITKRFWGFVDLPKFLILGTCDGLRMGSICKLSAPGFLDTMDTKLS